MIYEKYKIKYYIMNLTLNSIKILEHFQSKILVYQQIFKKKDT